MNYTIEQIELTGICRILHPTEAETHSFHINMEHSPE